MSEIPSTYDEALAWLNERVGKTVYRGPVWPEAVGPYLSNPAAIYITDKWHAQYLHDYAMECGVVYFDEPQK